MDGSSWPEVPRLPHQTRKDFDFKGPEWPLKNGSSLMIKQLKRGQAPGQPSFPWRKSKPSKSSQTPRLSGC